MKKKLLIFLVMVLAVSTLITTITCCTGKEKHSHVFDKSLAGKDYLLSPATCEDKAVYYHSCSCGEKGTTTFEYGESLGHNFVNYVSNGDATYEADGTKTAVCERNCGEEDTVEDAGSMLKSTLTIVFGNGEEDLVLTQNYGSDIEEVADPKRVGHTFTGWDSEIPSVMPAGNSTVTATWQVNQYKLTIVLGSGEEDIVLTQDYGSEISAVANPERVGYTFTGWDSEIPSVMPAEDLTINAKWQVNQYTLTIVLNNGEEDIVLTQDYNSDIEEIADPEKVGYKFSGWDRRIPSKMPAENVTVNATWSVAKYKITFVLDNGEEDIVVMQDYNSDVLINAPNPTKLGYTFAGWDGKIPSIMPAEDITITAKWEINQYTLTIVLHNGEEDIVIKQDYNSEIGEIVDPTKLGYKFAGWDRKIPSVMPAEDITINATWSVAKYKITFVLDNGEEDIVMMQDYNSDVLINAPNPTKLGYTFAGWEGKIPSIMPAEDITITAKWEINQYTLTIVLNNGEEDIVIKQDYNSEIGEIAAPTKLGYKFAGWDRKIPSVMPAEDITINATWSVAQYTLTIVFDNGDDDIVITQDYGSDIFVSIPTPTKELHDFVGWDKDIPSTMPSEDMTITARWEVIEEMRNFIFNYSSEKIEITGVKDKNVTTLVVPDYVTDIAEGAFNDCANLKTLVIGNGVTTLPGGLLKGCGSLQSLTIPFVGGSKDATKASANTLFGYIFGGENYEGAEASKQSFFPNSTETYYIPSSLGEVTVTGGKILFGAFNDCRSLKKVNLPEGLETIDAYAFYDCIRLISIEIPDSVTSIGDFSFNGCSSLVQITLGESVQSIGISAFLFSPKITEVFNKSSLPITENPEEYGYITYHALNVYTPNSGESKLSVDENGCIVYADGEEKILVGYQGESSHLIIADGTTKINPYALQYCREIIVVTMPNTLKEIGHYAFANCTNLQHVEVPNSVKEISHFAFGNCSSLHTLIIGNGVELIDSEILKGCGSLQNLTLPFVGRLRNPYHADYTSLFGHIFGGDSYEGGVAVKQYYSENGSETFYIPATLKRVTVTGGKLLYGAFYGCDTISQIILENVTSIGEKAFVNCKGLTLLGLDNRLTEVDKSAFMGCDNLAKVEYNGDINDWAQIVFADEYNPISNDVANLYIDGKLVTNITLSAENVNAFAFYRYTKLVSVTIGANVKSIGDSAFVLCENLESVVFEENSTCKRVGNDAFWGCEKLVSIKLPASLTKIGRYAFAECNNLTNVIIEGENKWNFVKYANDTVGITMSNQDFANSSVLANYLTNVYSERYWTR